MSFDHIVLTIKELALSDPSQKDRITKLQILDNEEVLIELEGKDDIFTSQMLIDKEIANDLLMVYLFQEEEILFAGEFIPEVPQNIGQKVVTECLLKSPDENDAGFVMFESFLEVKEEAIVEEEEEPIQ